jgi:hypothetical protein
MDKRCIWRREERKKDNGRGIIGRKETKEAGRQGTRLRKQDGGW